MLVNNRASLSVSVKKKTRVVFSLSLPHSLWFFVPLLIVLSNQFTLNTNKTNACKQ
jgi:hypothetical protein